MRQRKWFAAVTSVFGPDEIVLGAGLVLLTLGLWSRFAWLSLIVPGLTLLWIALPTRRRFIEPVHPTPERRK